MARTKTNTQNNTKTRRTPRRNRPIEKHTFSTFFGEEKERNMHELSPKHVGVT